MARSEEVHARRHLIHLKIIGSSTENLRHALEGEAQAFQSMYPRMAADAKEEGEQGLESGFSRPKEVEKVRHALLRNAKEDTECFPVQDYFVRNACGYIAEKESPEVCPACSEGRKVLFNMAGAKTP